MTKKDFELIASVFRDAHLCFVQEETMAHAAITKAARLMSRELCSTNERFDRDRFLRACGVSD